MWRWNNTLLNRIYHTPGHIPWENHNSKWQMYPSVYCNTTDNSQDMEATSMSIDRWMGKEDVVHTYKGILLSHKKEWIWISSSEVDEPWAGYTEWSKSEKQMSYLNTYIWNLEKWYWWIYLQGRNGDAVVEYGLVDTVGEGEHGMNGEVASTYICIYTHHV